MYTYVGVSMCADTFLSAKRREKCRLTGKPATSNAQRLDAGTQLTFRRCLQNAAVCKADINTYVHIDYVILIYVCILIQICELTYICI